MKNSEYTAPCEHCGRKTSVEDMTLCDHCRKWLCMTCSAFRRKHNCVED